MENLHAAESKQSKSGHLQLPGHVKAIVPGELLVYSTANGTMTALVDGQTAPDHAATVQSRHNRLEIVVEKRYETLTFYVSDPVVVGAELLLEPGSEA